MRLTLVIASLALAAGSTRANYYFYLPGEKGAKLVFNSTPKPDETASLDPARRGGARTVAGKDGRGVVLSANPETPGALVAEVAPGESVASEFDHGVGLRGVDPVWTTHRAAWQPDARTELDADKLGLCVRAKSTPAGVLFVAHLDGKPAQVEVVVLPPGGAKPVTLTTGLDGQTRPFTEKGVFHARARHTEIKQGEAGGKLYKSRRQYATLGTVAE